MVESTHPDLVLLDVMMPKLNGYDVCEKIKRNPATRLTPVVLVTALHERERKIEGINAGADDFLTKPVDPHELKARASSLVRLKRYTDDLDSAESVIMSLALSSRRATRTRTVTASGWPRTQRHSAPRCSSAKKSSRRCFATAIFMTSARSAFLMNCC